MKKAIFSLILTLLLSLLIVHPVASELVDSEPRPGGATPYPGQIPWSLPVINIYSIIIIVVFIIVAVVVIAYLFKGKGVKGKVVFLGIGIIATFLIISAFILPWLGFEIEFLASPFGYILILLTGGLIALSGFLPWKWGNILREIAYFCFFITLILVEINLMKPFVHATKIDLEKCQVGAAFPSGEQLKKGTFVYNTLQFTSCVLTGYFPAEMGDIGWTSFYIFYLILPFAFAWTFTYGLMSGMEMENWFGAFGKTAIRIFSFIFAMYAARVLFGAFLLDFVGYGIWGLAALFVAAFFTKGLGKIMKDWYVVEAMAETTRTEIEKELGAVKRFGEAVKPILDSAKKLADDEKLLTRAKVLLGTIRETEYYKLLPEKYKTSIMSMIDEATKAGVPKTRFKQIISEIEKYCKSIAA
jgi:hypothetical protein